MNGMAPDVPTARDDDATDPLEDDDAPEGITTKTKVLWAIGAVIGLSFIVSGVVGIVGG
ncbi:hypothetical protein ATL42_3080 [Sanguibacter antarcticus]|uniref:Uncharacterized protein n=2 Tax=Sanguibacter antarcticus TaxID=372484 RepID=A0A2A9EA58_9MICO|nr:hypothetical protein ATL42_3080 [Sanguibacter antarcticus]